MKLKKVLASILALCMVLSTMGTVTFANDTVDTWDGTVDTSWYDATATEVTIETAEQLAGLAELVSGDVTFNGVRITLAKDLDLYCGDTTENADGDPLTFRPIGDISKDGTFEGIFDGDGHTISNLYQNGWDLGYQWGVYGSYGLFGNVNNATIKNLKITGSESYIEGGDVSCIAGSATGTCTFENIVIEDSVAATYNNGCGTIIGWSGEGNYTFSNITIADTVTLAGLWGSFDSSIGGVVGQAEPGASYTFNKVNVACRLDAYNDVTASYDYYNYRMSGMLIGRLEKTTSVDGASYPDPSQYTIVCNDVNVTFGEWANYHYCRAEGARGVRVEAGYAYDGIAADYDHSVCTVHHMECIPFTAIFGGDQYAVKGADEKALEKLPGTEDIVSGLEVTDLAYKARTAVQLYMPENVARSAQLILVDSFGSLEEALVSIGDKEGEFILKVIKDIEESVTVTQYANQKITICGDEDNKPVISGSITVNGRSNAEEGEALTIQNLVFNADAVTTDAVVFVPSKGARYAMNITIDSCEVIGTTEDAFNSVALFKESTGGGKNLVIKNTTIKGIHSLVQAKNTDGVTIDKCDINGCKNGINLNSCPTATITNTTADIEGYAVRIGQSDNVNTPALDYTMAITLEGNTFTSSSNEDALIIARGGAQTADIEIKSGTYMNTSGLDVISLIEGSDAVISGGDFSSNVEDYLAEKLELTKIANGFRVVDDEEVAVEEEKQADTISVIYKDVTETGTEGEKIYEIILKANEGDMINELASADLTFAYTTAPVTGGAIDFVVAPAEKFSMTRYENTNRYMFNYNGVDAYEDTANEIVIGTIKVTGYGKFTIATKNDPTNIVNATTLYDNLVSYYTVAGAKDNDEITGGLDITDCVRIGEIALPTRELTIKIDFPNAVEDNAIAYQDMKVEITGNIDGVNKTVTYALGGNMTNNSYVVTEDKLVLNNAYTVTVSGAGYRTARYTVTMTTDKTLRFWNNVMDENHVVELGKDSSIAKVTFLAGDIVKDNNINIYDLSAVVSYFGQTNDTTAYSNYAKYDLNRDGVIDSKDVAYVLVSWNN